MERLQRLSGQICASSSSDRLQIRELEAGDYHKGFFQLLSQLTQAPQVPYAEFAQRLKEQKNTGYNAYRVAVIEDLDKKQIIATATLFIERKFVRNLGLVGHVEDVVVNSTYRGKNLGIRVIQQLKDWAKEAGCYKVILDCSQKNTTFYQKLGFETKEVQMAVYFH
jgi:glucosamine-phosphate N-acetyltransferase